MIPQLSSCCLHKRYHHRRRRRSQQQQQQQQQHVIAKPTIRYGTEQSSVMLLAVNVIAYLHVL